MAVETVTFFFALLAAVAALTTMAVVFSAMAGDALGVLTFLRPVAIELAAAVAVTATIGSLYLSEVAGFDPCRLCWVQRAFMYPAGLLLVIAAVTGRQKPMLVAGLLAIGGLAVAVFHRVEQAAGGFGSICDPSTPCSSRWVEHFGFVTIPTMAAAGFAAVVALVALASLRPTEAAIDRS